MYISRKVICDCKVIKCIACSYNIQRVALPAPAGSVDVCFW